MRGISKEPTHLDRFRLWGIGTLMISSLIVACGTEELCWCPPGDEDCPPECLIFDCRECDYECPVECEPGNGGGDICEIDPTHPDCVEEDICEIDPNHPDCIEEDICEIDPNHPDCIEEDICEIDSNHPDCIEECDPPVCGEIECGRVYNDCEEWIECGECAGDYTCEEGVCMLPACPFEEVVNGQATYYYATGGGNCSYPTGTGMPYVVAMSTTDYASGAYCGACLEVNGPHGQVVVRVVDRCPGCSVGHIDLSSDAFAAISPLSAGLIDVTWRYIPCDFDEPLYFFWESGSDRWWSSVQVRRHRNAIDRFEVRNSSGDFVTISRQTHNMYFMSGMGPGPFDFRITDVYGNELVEEGIPLSPGSVVHGTGQFPDCDPDR